MITNNDIRHGRHCTFLMHVHLVFVTKYRRNVFTKEILDDLRPLFAGVCTDFFREWLAKRLRQGMGAGGICRLGTQQTVKRQMHRAGKRSKSLGSK